jgi:hypothetical protein
MAEVIDLETHRAKRLGLRVWKPSPEIWTWWRDEIQREEHERAMLALLDALESPPTT